jgi:ubiquinone/menaquinone biosynthesis C-methylase UbiE
VTFQEADIFQLPFSEASFDHVFVCSVLEHLREPGEAATRGYPQPAALYCRRTR